MTKTGITVFECTDDEAALFFERAPRYGVEIVATEEPATKGCDQNIGNNRSISVSHKSPLSKRELAALKKAGVQHICTRSIGYDHIDVEAARNYGITVDAVTYSPDGVADYTLMLMLMAVRNAKRMILNGNRQDFRLGATPDKELRDMTVGVVGAGRIGAAVMKRLEGFGCNVMACDQEEKLGCVPLQELLEKSDIVTLHAPLTSNTFHLIGKAQLKRMKPRALLINTARGALVNTEDLIKALEDGTLGGAALDVLEGEDGIFYADCAKQKIDNPFLATLQSMPNVIVSPHAAYYTDRMLKDSVEKTIVNCLEFERGKNHG